MRIRRATSLVTTFENDTIVVHNYLQHEFFGCNSIALDILAQLDDWTDIEAFIVDSEYEPRSLTATVAELIGKQAILVEGSDVAETDEKFRHTWRWGVVAGLYQFSLRDLSFADGKEIRAKMERYQAIGDAPPLLTDNEGLPTTTLPPFPVDDEFFAELQSRESRREYTGKPIALDALSACLYAANGVKNIDNHGPFGTLPKTMTPSGGARNPFELFIYARAVDGLEPGFYHYSAATHDLGRLPTRELPQPVELLGTQTWTNEAAAVVFMVAVFERTAWKYRQPLAYRVVLMETGYIAQNLLLAANRFGIAAAPTGALSESRIETILGTRPVEQAALFAVVLGDPVEPFRH